MYWKYVVWVHSLYHDFNWHIYSNIFFLGIIHFHCDCGYCVVARKTSQKKIHCLLLNLNHGNYMSTKFHKGHNGQYLFTTCFKCFSWWNRGNKVHVKSTCEVYTWDIYYMCKLLVGMKPKKESACEEYLWSLHLGHILHV